MASSTAIARREQAIARASHRSSISRVKAKADQAVTGFRERLRKAKAGERANLATMVIASNAGGIISGQVAKRKIMPNDDGESRGHLLNYGAGALAFLAVVTGKVNSKMALGLVAVGTGMSTGQFAIYSKESDLDLWPFGEPGE